MYCEVEEVRQTLKIDALDALIGDEYIEDETEKESKILEIIKEAVIDADGEINGYLNKRYTIPLKSVPKVINKFSKDIAVYNLFSRQGIEPNSREENYFERYKAAVKFLENVAKGVIDIGYSDDSEAVRPKSAFITKSSRRIFNRKSMEGM